MVVYFVIHNRQQETVVCTFIFLLSVFYAAITYEDVYDLAKIEETMDVQAEFDENAYNQWKNEYAHPLVVGFSRRRDVSQVRKVHEVNNYAEIKKMGDFNS
jgi:hypothetical protein